MSNVREREHFKDTRINGKIILNWILKKLDRDFDWIVWAQDRIKGRALASSVMKMRDISELDELLASHKGLCSMESVKSHNVPRTIKIYLSEEIGNTV